jgi:hypothetical protein
MKMGAQPIPKTLHFHYRTTQWINFRKVAVLNTMCMLILTKPKLLNMVYHNFSADSFIFEVIESLEKDQSYGEFGGLTSTASAKCHEFIFVCSLLKS